MHYQLIFPYLGKPINTLYQNQKFILCSQYPTTETTLKPVCILTSNYLTIYLGTKNGIFPLRNLEQCYVPIFGAFAKLPKATNGLIMSVCPSAPMETLSSLSTDFHEI